MLTREHLDRFHSTGHLTVPDVFSVSQMDAAVEDATRWGQEVVSTMDGEQRRWYLEGADDAAQAKAMLRKLDNPVFHRSVFRELALSDQLVALVEQLVGDGVRVFFSQVFFKPPEHGGPKPLHQDNFYFGPSHDDAMVTAWIALDEATVENGCLYYVDGSNRGALLEHYAPEGQPFNLQLRPEAVSSHSMTPAPVPKGGVSFHHGRTLHQSSANRSSKWRRAAAVHYLQNDAVLQQPALPYGSDVVVACGR